MPEGWRLYKGARVVNDHIASLLEQLSEAQFQRLIRGIEFNCYLKVRQLEDHFNLELTLSLKTGAIKWYPRLLSWYTINKALCRVIEGSALSLKALVPAVRVPRQHVPIIVMDNRLLRQPTIYINFRYLFWTHRRLFTHSQPQLRIQPVPVESSTEPVPSVAAPSGIRLLDRRTPPS
ncbi:hypothetical protein FRC03_011497 [Tulasnella sp. 419]|nr:hypothetical protein FRC03_011497 [Tulasnella sp. 419]